MAWRATDFIVPILVDDVTSLDINKGCLDFFKKKTTHDRIVCRWFWSSSEKMWCKFFFLLHLRNTTISPFTLFRKKNQLAKYQQYLKWFHQTRLAWSTILPNGASLIFSTVNMYNLGFSFAKDLVIHNFATTNHNYENKTLPLSSRLSPPSLFQYPLPILPLCSPLFPYALPIQFTYMPTYVLSQCVVEPFYYLIIF